MKQYVTRLGKMASCISKIRRYTLINLHYAHVSGGEAITFSWLEWVMWAVTPLPPAKDAPTTSRIVANLFGLCIVASVLPMDRPTSTCGAAETNHYRLMYN